MIPILLVAVLLSASALPAETVIEYSITTAASPLQVYNAFASDWQIRQWSSAQSAVADARPGGVWRWTFSPDSLQEGVFESAERASQLVFSHIIRGEDTRVHCEILPAGDSTEMHLVIKIPADGRQAEMMRASSNGFWSSLLPRLEYYLNCRPGGYFVKPAGEGSYPAVLLLHDRFGVNRTVRAFCDSLAASGYTALAADMFRGEVTADLTQGARFVELVKPEDALAASRRAFACLQGDSAVQTNRIAVWGLDFGATIALNLAAHEPKLRGAVVWQGCSPPELEILRRMAAPVMAIFTDTDVNRPRIEITAFSQQMTQAGVRNDVAILSGTREFSDPAYGAGYSAGIAVESWQRTLRFLDRQLRIR